MGHINRIDFSQLQSAKALASALQGVGELRVSEGKNTEGTEVVFLRERTFIESVKDFFGINAKSRRVHAEAALRLIEDFLTKHTPSDSSPTQRDQTILNIRTETHRQKSFTGSVVAEEMQQLLNNKKITVDPLKNGPVVASCQAKTGINLMSVSPMRVMADHAVLRSTTLVTALQANPECVDMVDEVQSIISKADFHREKIVTQGGLNQLARITDIRLTTPSVLVVPDLTPKADSDDQPAIGQEQLKLLYKNALIGKSGTLVMEPFPDQITRDKSGTRPTFSDIGLKIMMKSIGVAVSQAKANNKRLDVTIATTDEALIKRLKFAYARQQNTLKPEDESSSEEESSPDHDGTGVFPG